MVLFNIPLGVFAWTTDENEGIPQFTSKFQAYLSEFLLSVNDCKKLRGVLNINFKTKTEVLFIINNYIKLKNPGVFGNVSDELFLSWKNETMRQLDIYEAKFTKFV